MGMKSLILFFVGICFLFLWWIRNNQRKKNKNIKGYLVSEGGLEDKPFRDNQSKFQKWLLDYAGINMPEDLPKELRIAYSKDSWYELDPSIYSKWSKFHWGI